MPKVSSMESVQVDLEQYARDELAYVQGRGLFAALEKRLGIAYSTIKRAYEGTMVSAKKAREIRHQIAETRTIAWPQEPGRVRAKYEALQGQVEPETFDATADMMELAVGALLKHAESSESATSIEVPFWHYLRGYIATDRAAHLLRLRCIRGDAYAQEHDRCEYEKNALKHYSNAYALLTSACDAVPLYKVRYGHFLDKLRFSMFAAHFNIHQPGERAKSKALTTELRQGDYISLIDKISHSEPRSRTIQHAGLVLASVLGETEDGPLRDRYARLCEVFHARLSLADERFNDLAFQPADFTHSLASDPDLTFFRSLPAIRSKLAPRELARTL